GLRGWKRGDSPMPAATGIPKRRVARSRDGSATACCRSFSRSGRAPRGRPTPTACGGRKVDPPLRVRSKWGWRRRLAKKTRKENIEALLQAGRSVGTASVMFHEAVAERLGIGASEHKALDLLRRYGEMTAGALTEHTGLTSGAVTGIIDRLERAGLAE